MTNDLFINKRLCVVMTRSKVLPCHLGWRQGTNGDQVHICTACETRYWYLIAAQSIMYLLRSTKENAS